MKLIKLNKSQLQDSKEVPDLLTVEVKYDIKGGSGELDYHGPRFDPEMWHQVLSFFRWTFKEMNSESQVRLYVNTKLGRWAAWAFPQEARTGMNAREIATPETAEQAKTRFGSWQSEPSGDWLYFCTVHHHCSASAFQSSTDEANERNQDGLHLTVGRMDAERHDLHARFYLNGNCYEPDLSRFWPVDAELAQRLPSSLHDELARYQMGEKVVVDFPDAWRQNVIEMKSEDRATEFYGLRRGWELERSERPAWLRIGDALRALADDGASRGMNEDEVLSLLHSVSQDETVMMVLETCLKHEVTPEQILDEAQAYETQF